MNDKCTNVFIVAVDRLFGTPTLLLKTMELKGKEWEWEEEFASPHASDDFETVVFQHDFCEGQTCVKDLIVVPFDEVSGFYAEMKGLKGGAE